MNKRLLSLIILFPTALFFFAGALYSNSSKAPTNSTNAPSGSANMSCGAGTLGCHGPDPLAALDLSNFTVLANGTEIDDNFMYEGGTSYAMSVTLNDSSDRNGFALTIRNASNEPVGVYTASSTTSVGNNDNYITHNNASALATWTFDWTAPAAGAGDLNIYIAANKSNNNGNAGAGDLILPYEKTISEDVSASIGANQLLENTVIIKRNPIVSETLEFDFHVESPSKFSFVAYSITGEKISSETNRMLHNGVHPISMELNDAESGLYILSIKNDKNASKQVKFLKQ